MDKYHEKLLYLMENDEGHKSFRNDMWNLMQKAKSYSEHEYYMAWWEWSRRKNFIDYARTRKSMGLSSFFWCKECGREMLSNIKLCESCKKNNRHDIRDFMQGKKAYSQEIYINRNGKMVKLT